MACGTFGESCQSCFIGSACVGGLCIGGSGAGGGSGTAGGGGAGGGTGQLSFRAYQLVIAGRAVSSPGCYRDNRTPATLDQEPSRTLEVLLWDTPSGEHFIALPDLGPSTLGDSPTITPPQGIRSPTPGSFAFARNLIGEYPGRRATEARQTLITFTFVNAEATSTTGTLALTSQYACVSGQDECPVPNLTPDSASCSVRLDFTARLVPMTSKWTTPVGAELDGATRYLTATAPLPPSSDPSCYWRNVLPAGAHVAEQGGVQLDVWQRARSGDSIRTAPMRFTLGTAPAVEVARDFMRSGSAYEVTSRTSRPMPGVQATEVRETRAAFDFYEGDEVLGPMNLTASYACLPGADACPVPNPSPDSVSCAMQTFFTAVRLP